MKILLIICSFAALSACSWVDLTKEGSRVQLVKSNDAISNCKNLGSITSKVLSKVVIERDANKVSRELATLARNQAVKLKGNTIIPTSTVVNGQRSYAVYQCLDSK